MKHLCLLVGALLCLNLVAGAAGYDRASPCLLDKTKPNPADVLRIAPTGHPVQRTQPAGELNEFFGDTVHVGYTWYDLQQNATIGRMIQYNPWGYDSTGVAYLAYSDMYTANGARHVHYQEVTGGEVQYPGGAIVDGGDRAGFPTVARNPITSDGGAVMVYHGRSNSNDAWNTVLGAEFGFIPGVFVEHSLPWEEDFQIIWPKSTMDGDSIVHTLSTSTGLPEGSRYWIYYSKQHVDLAGPTFTSHIDPTLVTDQGEFISGDIACTNDGGRVAIAQPINRARLLGEEEPWWLDQDLYLWLSENRGDDFQFGVDNATNITNFIDPDPDLFPDSVAACRDTFRLYMDVSTYFDDNDVLHLSFSTLQFFYYLGGGDGAAYLTAQLWYWNEEDGYIVRIGDGDFWNNTALGANQITIQRPSLYKDPDDGWLYCLYQQYGVPGDTLTEGENAGMGQDRSEGGYLNSELFITASPPGENQGLYWFPGLNITDTRGTGGQIPAGECMSERDASLSLNNDGDYLHIMYNLDLDAGTSVFATPEGISTENPIVYGTIEKATLQQTMWDSVLARGYWLEGLPIHVDSSDFWDDPNNWEVGVEETELELLPDQFELGDVYPNPFNSTAKIRFHLAQQGQIRLEVYDLLGRKVSTLFDQAFEAGTHEALFEGHTLSSGVYFVKLSSGTTSQAKKLTLIK